MILTIASQIVNGENDELACLQVSLQAHGTRDINDQDQQPSPALHKAHFQRIKSVVITFRACRRFSFYFKLK